MKKLILGVAFSIAMVGCGNYTGDTSVYEEAYVGGDNTVIDNSVDISITCTENNDTMCYTPDRELFKDADGTYDDVADTPSGVYDASYSPAECAANGYFFCSIEQKCLNIPATTGSCN